jgi:hypothetical protein
MTAANMHVSRPPLREHCSCSLPWSCVCAQVPYPTDGPKQFALQWWILMFEVRPARACAHRVAPICSSHNAA